MTQGPQPPPPVPRGKVMVQGHGPGPDAQGAPGHRCSAEPRPRRLEEQPGGSLPFLLLHAIVKTFEKEFAGRYLPVRAVSSAQYCREMVLELQLPAP